MDGLSCEPSIFKKENVIFNTFFGKNLWNLELKNDALVNYDDLKDTLETYNQENWDILKDLKLNYLLSSESSSIDLNRIWED